MHIEILLREHPIRKYGLTCFLSIFQWLLHVLERLLLPHQSLLLLRLSPEIMQGTLCCLSWVVVEG